MPESVVGMGDRSGAGTSKSLVDARETFQTLHEISRLLNTGDTQVPKTSVNHDGNERR